MLGVLTTIQGLRLSATYGNSDAQGHPADAIFTRCSGINAYLPNPINVFQETSLDLGTGHKYAPKSHIASRVCRWTLNQASAQAKDSRFQTNQRTYPNQLGFLSPMLTAFHHLCITVVEVRLVELRRWSPSLGIRKTLLFWSS
jgi:hypothetical protein